ncbi:MAG: helix-turn-helix domain-containing protein [Caulobacteraceae bacterium]
MFGREADFGRAYDRRHWMLRSGAPAVNEPQGLSLFSYLLAFFSILPYIPGMKRAIKTTEAVSQPVRNAAGRALTRLRAGGTLVVEGGHERIDLPLGISRKVEALLVAYAEGQSPSVLAPEDDLTTQQAADLLGLSRPTVVKMMDAGRLPYQKPGAHRRVRRADLEAFQAALKRDQRGALAELSALGQEMEREAREDGSFDDDMI